MTRLDLDPPSTPHDPSRTRRRRSSGRPRVPWPPLVLAALAVLLGLRLLGDGGTGEASTGPTTAARSGGATSTATGVEVARRDFDGLQLDVPAGWATLDRTRAHVVWGAADRRHTVTLGSTEASVLPLPGVVAAVARDSAAALPGARLVGRPETVTIDGAAPRDDAAMLLRFEVADGPERRLDVVQVWRRDTRAGRDVVATWTSADGSWPVPPRTAVPRVSDSR